MLDYSPDVIAYSSTTYSFPPIAIIAEEIRKKTKAVSICGGPHPTLYPEDTLKASAIDYICVGDGERPLLEFVEAVGSRQKEINIGEDLWSKNVG